MKDRHPGGAAAMALERLQVAGGEGSAWPELAGAWEEGEPPAGGCSSFESGYQSLPSHGGDEEDPEDPEGAPGVSGPGRWAPPEARLKVDFFRKLGYSPAQTVAVLQKRGWAADTDTVLGELVRHGGAGGERRRRRKQPPLQQQQQGGTPEESPEEESPPRETPHRRPPQEEEEEEEEKKRRKARGQELRPVVIDGSNVAMSHGVKDVFSCRGILLAVNWFLERGHTDITVFVPSWRKEQPRPDVPITDQDILLDLERRKILVFTPSRRVGGKRVVCYDDRFIVKLAYESDGIVVSNDTYRDLQMERPDWKKFIEERLLMYSFVNDKFMPPDDPLGRHGPSLENFLRKKPMVPDHKKQQCPYGKKCTYGVKCKFYHPERLNQVQQSVADELRANARLSPTQSSTTTITAKEERMSRRPPQGDPMASEGGEKLPLQKAPSAEKGSSTRKGKLGDRSPHSSNAVGGIPPVSSCSASAKKGSSSSHYRPADWYQPPPASPCMDSLAYVSQDHLDSGIGSLEGQLSEMWPGPPVPRSHYSHQEPPGMGSYRGLGASYQHSSGTESSSYHLYQPQGYQQPISASSTGFLPYGPELPSGPAPPPHSFSGYAMPADSSLASGRKYWSEPAYQPAPRARQDLPRGPQMAYDDSPSSCPWPALDRFAEERDKVRVKLCGIFHPHLVDAVMSRFPHLLDPQQLAAEILTYKSQNPRV